MAHLHQQLLIVRGLKRTGNHAIISWLRAQDNFLFFNNLFPMAAILRGEKTIPPPEDYQGWLRRRIRPLRRLLPTTKRRPVIVSLEDHALDLNPFLNLPSDVHNILILRDPANLFASRLRKGSRDHHIVFPCEINDTMRKTIDLWKAYAREFMGDTNVLTNKTCIYFNTWFADEDYRKSISRQLGLQFSDAGYSSVSDRGGGSSFDRTAFNHNNQAMRVLDRHTQLDEKERDVLETILQDAELQTLAQRVETMCQTSSVDPVE